MEHRKHNVWLFNNSSDPLFFSYNVGIVQLIILPYLHSTIY